MVVLVSLETVALALLAVLVAGLLRSHGDILRRLHDLGVSMDPDGTAHRTGPLTLPPGGASLEIRRNAVHSGIFDIAGTTPSGDALAVGVTSGVRNTMLAFLSSGCATCTKLWSALADPSLAKLPGDPRVVIVTRDASSESPSAVAKLAGGHAKVVMSSRAWEDYGVPGSPYFVFVDARAGSVTGEGSATSWDQLANLVAQAGADAGPPGKLAQGHSAGGPKREARVDAELARAGILPGDPSLYPATTRPIKNSPQD